MQEKINVFVKQIKYGKNQCHSTAFINKAKYENAK